MNLLVEPGFSLKGEVALPGDSLFHIERLYLLLWPMVKVG